MRREPVMPNSPTVAIGIDWPLAENVSGGVQLHAVAVREQIEQRPCLHPEQIISCGFVCS